MTAPALQSLRESLDALQDALDDQRIDDAAGITKAYADQLQLYIATVGRDAPLDVMRQLLALQNTLLLRMRERQTAIGDALRQVRRQDSASRAYTDIEVGL